MSPARIFSAAVALLVTAIAAPGAAEVQRRAIGPHAHSRPRRAVESTIGTRTAERGRALTPPRHTSGRPSVQGSAIGPFLHAGALAQARTSGQSAPATLPAKAGPPDQVPTSPPIVGKGLAAVAVAPAEQPPVEGKLRYGNTCRRASRAAVRAAWTDSSQGFSCNMGVAPRCRSGSDFGRYIHVLRERSVEQQLGFQHFDCVTEVHGERIGFGSKAFVLSQILRPGRTWIQVDRGGELEAWCVDLY